LGVSNVIYEIVKFANPNTTSTAGTVYAHIETFLGCMFYVSFVLLVVALGIFIWDFFREKEEEKSMPTGATITLDFTRMTPKQISDFMDRLKDMSSAQIGTLLGGQHAKAIKETVKHAKEKGKASSKAEREKKGSGKTQDNQRPIP